jgi:hypothetical protein
MIITNAVQTIKKPVSPVSMAGASAAAAARGRPRVTASIVNMPVAHLLMFFKL